MVIGMKGKLLCLSSGSERSEEIANVHRNARGNKVSPVEGDVLSTFNKKDIVVV
jgi:hypothetical protein